MVVLNLLVKPGWVLLEMALQDRLGHEAWGTYAALLALGYLFLTLADLGINQFATQGLASDRAAFELRFPALLGAKIVLALAFPFLMLAIGFGLGYRGNALELLFWLSLVQSANQFAQVYRARIQALQLFQVDAWLSVAERLLLLGLTALLLWLGLTMDGFVAMRLLAVLATLGLFLLAALRHGGLQRPSWDPGLLAQAIRQSLPFAFMTILYSVHDKIDQVMIERLIGSEPSGLYAAAYRWLEAFSMFLWLVLPIFFARFAHHLYQPDEQQRLLVFGQKITAIPLIFVSLFVLFFGEQLLFLFGNSSPEQIQVMNDCLQVLFLTVMFNSIFAIFSTLLTSTGHVRPVNRMIIGAILLNILLNWLYIPAYGPVASAWTTLASYVAVNIGYTIYLHRRIRVPYWQMTRLALLAGLGAAAFSLLSSTGWPWWMVTALAGMVYLGLLPVMGLLRLSDLSALRR